MKSIKSAPMNIHSQVTIYISVFNSLQFAFISVWDHFFILLYLTYLYFCMFLGSLQLDLAFFHPFYFLLILTERLIPFVFKVLLIIFSLIYQIIFHDIIFSYILFPSCPASFKINYIYIYDSILLAY